MEVEIPQIDLPEEWLVGTDISREILDLYTNFPVRLKCEMIVFCMGGEIEASINVNRIHVSANDFVVLIPGSIIQIHNVEGELKLYVIGFSQQYIMTNHRYYLTPETLYTTVYKPKLTLTSNGARMMEDYFLFLIRLYSFMDKETQKQISSNLCKDVHTCILMLYKNQKADDTSISKNEQLCQNFTQLVFQHYTQTRNVSWYANKLGITHAYLCRIVKDVTGNTCINIISYMVIMDAKSQLKLSNLSIQSISDALNFPNMSFFGKYFKRHTGMSPLEYRNEI